VYSAAYILRWICILLQVVIYRDYLAVARSAVVYSIGKRNMYGDGDYRMA
jgi:hypothetical protein